MKNKKAYASGRVRSALSDRDSLCFGSAGTSLHGDSLIDRQAGAGCLNLVHIENGALQYFQGIGRIY